MKHEDRVIGLKSMHQKLLENVARFDPKRLPNGVDREKLEKAYDEMKGYAFVLKKL
jgi:hypothetical protein